MSKAIEAKRIIGLLAIAMAALMVVLSALAAPDAEAKKKHKKKHSSINVVLCPTENDNRGCRGTTFPDYLLGRDGEVDQILGGEGNDIYDGKDGSDSWFDLSTTSNDRYLVPSTEFGTLFVDDHGGSSDLLDLSAYSSTEFGFFNAGNVKGDGGPELRMDGPGLRDIVISDFLSDEDSVDSFKFFDGTLTAEQIKSKV